MVRRHTGRMICVAALVLVGVAWLAPGAALAQAAKGGERAKAPGGKEEGKDAWQKEVPPGWKQWSDKQKEGWKNGLDHARKAIREHTKARGDAALRGMEMAARKGVPLTDAEEMARTALDAGLDPADYDALAQSASDYVKQGLKGKDLAQAVQQAIERLKGGRTIPTVPKKEEKAAAKVQKAEAAQDRVRGKK